MTGNVSGGIVQLWAETFPGAFPVTFPKETEMMFQTGDRRQETGDRIRFRKKQNDVSQASAVVSVFERKRV